MEVTDSGKTLANYDKPIIVAVKGFIVQAPVSYLNSLVKNLFLRRRSIKVGSAW
jgi:hypothetical protein